MRSFERTQPFEQGILDALANRQFPAQVIWGKDDPALKERDYAPELCQVLGLQNWQSVPGKHFVQEDSSEAIAAAVQQLSATGQPMPDLSS
jgi:pimeloyl-ACP methyl ester carboxylesterase